MPETQDNLAIGQRLFSTATLVMVVNSLYSVSTFFIDNFYSGETYSNDEFVAIDIEIKKRRLAPFVSPLHEGKLVETLPIETRLFKPPYIKDKRIPDLKRPIRRMIGERIGGNDFTAQERYMYQIGMEVQDQLDCLKRRLEWMSVQSIVDGRIVVSGDGYPETVVDFLRDPSLNIVLSGKSMWDDPDTIADPKSDIRKWMANIVKLSGSKITDLIFTNSAFDALINNKNMQQPLFISGLRGTSDVNMQMGPMIEVGGMFQGSWGGCRIWLYNEWFVDEKNQEQPMIKDGMVIGISREIQGTIAYSAINNAEYGYLPVPYLARMWPIHDPSNICMMLESSPIPIMGRPNACFAARVAKGS